MIAGKMEFEPGGGPAQQNINMLRRWLKPRGWFSRRHLLIALATGIFVSAVWLYLRSFHRLDMFLYSSVDGTAFGWGTRLERHIPARSSASIYFTHLTAWPHRGVWQHRRVQLSAPRPPERYLELIVASFPGQRTQEFYWDFAGIHYSSVRGLSRLVCHPATSQNEMGDADLASIEQSSETVTLRSLHVSLITLVASSGSIFLIALLLPVRRVYLQRQRNLSGLCTTCGYDLRGSPERCPECGTPPLSAIPMGNRNDFSRCPRKRPLGSRNGGGRECCSQDPASGETAVASAGLARSDHLCSLRSGFFMGPKLSAGVGPHPLGNLRSKSIFHDPLVCAQPLRPSGSASGDSAPR
jgi:hypothetical protein